MGEKEEELVDEVNSPAHYTHGKFEPWDVIVDWELPYFPAAAVEYICRHQHKGTPKKDILKAIAFLNRYVKEIDKYVDEVDEVYTGH